MDQRDKEIIIEESLGLYRGLLHVDVTQFDLKYPTCETKQYAGHHNQIPRSKIFFKKTQTA